MQKKSLDKIQHPFMKKKLSTKWVYRNVPQHNKGHI